MPINLEGVEQLKADLRANAQAYKQATFGRVIPDDNGGEVCGTEQCMAGFCYLHEVGKEAYIDRIKAGAEMEYVCVDAGVAQLGIVRDDDRYCPDIFESHSMWPDDLAYAYRNATTADARVEVACAALDRLNHDGTIKYLDQI